MPSGMTHFVYLSLLLFFRSFRLMPAISRTARLAASRKIHTPALEVTPVNTEVAEAEGAGVGEETGTGESDGSGETEGDGLLEGSGVGVGAGEAEGRGSSSFSTI